MNESKLLLILDTVKYIKFQQEQLHKKIDELDKKIDELNKKMDNQTNSTTSSTLELVL